MNVSCVCVIPEGKQFSSLKVARDSFISPVDASQSTMAASADTRARDVMKPKEILGGIEDPTIRSSGLELLENIIASDDKARSEAFHVKACSQVHQSEE